MPKIVDELNRKHACSICISTATITKLANLCKYRHQKPNEIITDFINREYDGMLVSSFSQTASVINSVVQVQLDSTSTNY